MKEEAWRNADIKGSRPDGYCSLKASAMFCPEMKSNTKLLYIGKTWPRRREENPGVRQRL